MDLLEMPLEALALRFYSLPAAAAGSVWPWVAVLAAALGVWSIRAVGSRSDGSPSPPTPPPPKTSDACRTVRETPAASPAAKVDGHAAAPRAAVCHVEGSCGSPKARFTTYYSCESSSDVDEEDDGHGEEGVDDGVDGVTERVMAPWMEMRWRGDLGWYRYQDRSAINGSVVRLWDGDGALTATARRRPSNGWQG